MCFKLGHAKFQSFTLRGTFSNGGWMKGIGKSAFLMENWPYLGNSER